MPALELPDALLQLPRLSYLKLVNNPIRANFAQAKALRTLLYDDYGQTLAWESSVWEKMNQLEKIYLYANPRYFSPSRLSGLNKAPALSHLSISAFASTLDPYHALPADFLQQCLEYSSESPALKHLEISSFENYVDSRNGCLPQTLVLQPSLRFPQLDTLICKTAFQQCDIHLKAFPKLRVLHLLSDTLFSSLRIRGKRHRVLETLHIGSIAHIPDLAVFPNLQSLHIEHLERVQSIQNSSFLKELPVTACFYTQDSDPILVEAELKKWRSLFKHLTVKVVFF